MDRGTFDINGQAVNVIGNVTANPIAGNFSFQDSVGTGTLSIGGNINLNGTPTFGGIWTDVDIVALAAGANDASYCEISNSNNSSGNDIDATNNCVDNGGNIGWVFAGAPAVDVNPVTELLEIITPPVTVQYFPFINVDVQTETLLISTPPVNVEVFEDTTVIPATQFLNIITPPVDVNIGFDVDVNPLTEFLDIATPRVDVKTPVEFLIATEAQPLQYQVAIGGIVQMRAQLNVNAWRNENNWVSTPFPAVISTQPVGGSVTPGGAVSLSVTAIGAASYQWYLDGAALIGETGSTLNTTAPVIPGDYDYTCLALNADGFGVRSDAATVTVLTA